MGEDPTPADEFERSRTRAPSVSIVIPTKNSSSTIEAVLKGIFSQTLVASEIIVIDSGSVDDTVERASKYPVRVMHVSKFDHGATRNFGASSSTGDFIVFQNADAVPANNVWLENLIGCLANSAASFARSIPRNGFNVSERFFTLNTYSTMERIFDPKDVFEIDTRKQIVFSTVSGAVRRQVWNEFRFRENVLLGEDHEFGLRLLRAGYRISYAAKSVVIHSHDFSLFEVFRRYRKYGANDQEIGERVFRPVDDLRYLLKLYSGTVKFATIQGEGRNAVYGLFYNSAKFLGYLVGRLQSKTGGIRTNEN